MKGRKTLLVLIPLILLALLAACQAAAGETIVETVIVTQEVAGETVIQVVTATPEPAPPTPTPIRIIIEVTATPGPIIAEPRNVALEWPASMRLDESAIVRLTFNPDTGIAQAVVESEGAEIASGEVDVKHYPEYDVRAAAALDGVGFGISPAREQVRLVTEGEPLEWRWTITPSHAGTQRLNVVLAMRWSPPGNGAVVEREAVVYAKGLAVAVETAPILTGRMMGMAALGLGGAVILGWYTRWGRGGSRRGTRSSKGSAPLQQVAPNSDLSVEPALGMHLSPEERELLGAMFNRYGRLIIEQEFKSGYSGARALLARPIHADGRSDAHTIVKIGLPAAIAAEVQNYERFVADTLPPVTARIQHAPVIQRERAALRYTFIAEPGRTPASLETILKTQADPRLLWKLFDTFGPNWWMQRHPYTFRLGQEYDRKLPAHLVLEPAAGKGRPLDGRTAPQDIHFEIGEILTPAGFGAREPREGQWTLMGEPPPGNPPLRIRWLAGTPPKDGAAGRVVATRTSFLSETTASFDLCGLPDPLAQLPALLNETVRGTRAIIHGDLNLQNVLAGPGGMVWLIDFALTREGHTLYDFAHLHTEIIAHVLAPEIDHPRAWLEILRDNADPLLRAVQEIATRCLYDHTSLREYDLALALSCLGALKFANLDAHAKHLLHLTAAWALGDG